MTAQHLTITLNVAIVCATLLTALLMLRRSVERVSKQKHTVFMLLLPFGITWMFAGGESSSEVEEVVRFALLQRSRTAKSTTSTNGVQHSELRRRPPALDAERGSQGADLPQPE